MNNKKLKFLLAILVILIIMFIYYYYFSGRNKNSEPVNNVIAVSGSGINEMQAVGTESGSEGGEIVEILGRLKAIKMDTNFFQNESFNSLIDNSVELVPEPVGRINPFAPLQ